MKEIQSHTLEQFAKKEIGEIMKIISDMFSDQWRVSDVRLFFIVSSMKQYFPLVCNFI